MDDPMPPEGAARLTHLGVIRARGPDTTRFLQSQLTNDVAGMGLAEARLAGFCSAKGRLQASFIVWKPAPEDVLPTVSPASEWCVELSPRRALAWLMDHWTAATWSLKPST